MSELIIDESNFDQYFFETSKHRPKKGQVLAKFSAIANFGAGPHKRDVIHLLRMDKARQASAVMQKIHKARVPDCYRVCREICEDLLSGMSVEDVEQKEYEYVFETFYYTERENVPRNDSRWETIPLLDFDPVSGKLTSKIDI